MDKQDYINELRSRHGDSPELQELEKRYSGTAVIDAPQVDIDPEVAAKKHTSYVFERDLGLDPNTIGATYNNIVKNVYGQKLKPSQVLEKMKEDGRVNRDEEDYEELKTIAHSILTNQEPPKDLMQRRHQRDIIKQTADVFTKLRNVDDELFGKPTQWAADILKKPDNPNVIYAEEEYTDDDLLNEDSYRGLLERTGSKQQVDEIRQARKSAVSKLYYKALQQQEDFINAQGMSELTTGSKAKDVMLESAKGLYTSLKSIERGAWSTSVAMGMAWNQPVVENIDKAISQVNTTPLKMSGKIGYVTRAMGESIPSFAYNMTVGKAGIFVTEYGNAYQDAKDNGASDLKANIVATPVATINTIIESMQIEKIFKFAGGGKAAKDVIKKAVKDRAYKAFLKAGAKFTGESIKTAINEGIEGGLQEVTSIAVPAFVIDAYPKDENGNTDWVQIGSQVGKSFVGEGLGGLFLGTVGGIHNARQAQSYKEQVATNIMLNEELPENQALEVATRIVERLKNNDGQPKEIYREELGKIKMADNRHKAAAHIIAKGKAMPDTQYRQIAQETTGKESIKDMNYNEAELFISALKDATPEKIEGEQKQPETNIAEEVKQIMQEEVVMPEKSATIPSMAEKPAARDNIEPSKQQPSGKDGIDIESDEFIQKFGKSEVTDSAGDAKEVYHGTNAEFDSFDGGLAGTTTKHPTSQLGIFFTESEKDAKEFGTNIKKAYLKIENPKKYSNIEFEKLLDSGLEDWRDAFDNPKLNAKFKRLKNKLIKEGYDGIIVEPEFKTDYPELNYTNYVVFDKNQIISSFNSPAPEDGGQSKSRKARKVRGSFLDNTPFGDKDLLQEKIGEMFEVVKKAKPLKPKVDKKKNLAELKKRSKIGNIKTVAADSISGIDRAFGIMSTRLKNISPILFKEVRNKFINPTKIITAERTQAARPFVDGINKNLNEEDRYDFEVAQWQENQKEIDRIISKNKLVAEYQTYRKMLDLIYHEATAVGMGVDYKTAYFPSAIKDLDGLLKELNSKEEYAPIILAMSQAQEKKGRALNKDEQVQMIDSLLRGFNVSALTLSKPSFAKERTLIRDDVSLMKFYYGFDESTSRYIEAMTENIQARKFFGKTTKEIVDLRANISRTQTGIAKLESGETKQKWDLQSQSFVKLTPEMIQDEIVKRNAKLEKLRTELGKIDDGILDNSIGAYVLDLIKDGTIKYNEQAELRQIFDGIFKTTTSNRWIHTLRSLEYAGSLAQIPAMITQYSEIVLSILKAPSNVLPNFVKAHFNKSSIKLTDLGVAHIGQEWVDADLDKVVTTLLKPFEMADRIGKETFINSVVDKYRKLAVDSPEAVKKELSKYYPDEAFDSVINSLKSGKVDDNVKGFALNELADVQPISKMEVPELYAKAGNWRVFYMYKTFVLKRLDIIRNQAYSEIKAGIKEGDGARTLKGLAKLVWLLFMFSLADSSADMAKDLIRGKPLDTLPNYIADNLLQMILLSKYSLSKSTKEGASTFFKDNITLPISNLDSAFKDIVTLMDKDTEKGLETTRRIPWVGDLYYWYMGEGSRKIDEGVYDKELKQ